MPAFVAVYLAWVLALVLSYRGCVVLHVGLSRCACALRGDEGMYIPSVHELPSRLPPLLCPFALPAPSPPGAFAPFGELAPSSYSFLSKCQTCLAFEIVSQARLRSLPGGEAPRRCAPR